MLCVAGKPAMEDLFVTEIKSAAEVRDPVQCISTEILSEPLHFPGDPEAPGTRKSTPSTDQMRNLQ